MARRRKGNPIHGWINLDKPSGISSSQAVGRVKRLLGAAKVGHGGTLDPLATGVLPLALGEATKTVSYAMDGEKSYRFAIRFGAATSTDDAEGEVVETARARPSDAEIEAALDGFLGEISQVPPKYSAIKVGGERAYKLARSGDDPELAARTVAIHGLRLVDRPDTDHAVLEVDCGKGTYVRARAKSRASAVGTVGHVADLRRTRVAAFHEKDSISLDKLEALGHIAALSEHLMPVETVLADIPALALTAVEARRLKRGEGVALLPVLSRSQGTDTVRQGDVVYAIAGGQMVALATIKGGEVRPLRVLNMDAL